MDNRRLHIAALGFAALALLGGIAAWAQPAAPTAEQAPAAAAEPPTPQEAAPAPVTDAPPAENTPPAPQQDAGAESTGAPATGDAATPVADAPATPAPTAAGAEEHTDGDEVEIKGSQDKKATTKELAQMQSWRGSLMYSISDLRRLKEVIEAYERRLLAMAQAAKATGAAGTANLPTNMDPNDPYVQKLLSEMGQDTEAQLAALPPLEAPVVFLNSIAYISPDNWAVWINGRKYSPEAMPEDFELKLLSDEKVEIRWSHEDLDLISPGWREKVKLPLELPKDPALLTGNEIIYDQDNRIFTFRLHPNQSFVSNTMEVVEGRVRPTRISTGTPEPTPLTAEIPEEPEIPADNQPKSEKDLMNKLTGQYQDFTDEFISKKQSPTQRFKQGLGME